MTKAMKTLLFILLLSCSLAGRGDQQQKKDKTNETVSIRVQVTGLSDSISFSVDFWPKLSSASTSELSPKKHIRPYKTKNNCLYFRLKPDTDISYFSLNAKEGTVGKNLLYLYLAEAGDEITINLNLKTPITDWEMIGADPYLQNQQALKGLSVNFSGTGSAKYLCRYRADSCLFFGNSRQKISRFEQARAILEQYQNSLKPSVYKILLSGYISRNALSKLRSLRLSGLSYASSNEQKAAIKAKHEDLLEQISNQNISEQTILQSDSYVSFILAGLSFENITSGGTGEEQIYQRIKADYQGELKDKLITVFLLENLNKLKNISDLLADSQTQVKGSFYKSLLDKAANTFAEGAAAHDFALPDKTGKIVRFSDYKDKIVYLDFWFTGCGGCSYFYQHTLSKVQAKFINNPKVLFMSISIDQNKVSWIKSLTSKLYTSDQSINLYTRGKGSKHPVVSHYNISAYPTGILLNRGKVFSVHQSAMKDEAQLTQTIDSLLR